ncbi:MAG: hypothetical protein ABSA05_13555 [Opitutaceae bacterium]|jgi:hypothetical protein
MVKFPTAPNIVPRDPNQLAAYIVAQTAGMSPDQLEGKNLMAVVFGSMGGKKGGDARAKALSPEKRSKIAKKAAKARWKK